MRGDCKGRRAGRCTSEHLLRSRFNSRFVCDNKEMIYEEAPQAYKSIETIIDSLTEAGVIEVIARLTPVLTYKTLKKEAV